MIIVSFVLSQYSHITDNRQTADDMTVAELCNAKVLLKSTAKCLTFQHGKFDDEIRRRSFDGEKNLYPQNKILLCYCGRSALRGQTLIGHISSGCNHPGPHSIIMAMPLSLRPTQSSHYYGIHTHTQLLAAAEADASNRIPGGCRNTCFVHSRSESYIQGT